MSREELLRQLRDIGPPPEPAWWLPAPGHIILTLIGLAFILALFYWRAQRRSGLPLAQARLELRRIESAHARDGDVTRLAQELSSWLKRVALSAFPDRQLAGLSGKEWLQFLDQSLGSDGFSSGAGRVFAGEVYRREVVADTRQLLNLCERWLDRVGPRLSRRGQV